MKTLKFKNTEVKLSFDSYRNNGTLAVLMSVLFRTMSSMQSSLSTSAAFSRLTVWRSSTRTTCNPASEPG